MGNTGELGEAAVKMTLDQFSGLVSSIYDAALDASRWQVTLKELTTAFHGSDAALLAASPQSRHARHASVEPDHAAMKTYNEYYGRMDPVAALLEQVPAGAVFCGRETVQVEKIRRSEFYNDFATKVVEAGDGIYASLLRGGDGVGWLCLCAPLRPESFGSPERMRLMRLLVPHLQQAIRAQSSLGTIELKGRNAFEALDRLAHGVVLFDRDGSILFANRAAARIAALDDGLAIGRAGIRAALPGEGSALQGVIGRGVGKGRRGPRVGGTTALTRPSGRQPFVVHVLPMNRDADELSPGGTLVVIVDPEREPPALAPMLKRLYGLTPAEATVAIEVLRGDGLQSVANKMSVSISTVRIHLQRVFDKTATHRQAELARLLLTIEAGLDPSGLT